MHIALEQLLLALVGECYARRNTIFVFFVVISLSFLTVGSVWPKRYTSSALIHVDRTNILQPLMAGTAEATSSREFLSNAKQIILGDKIIEKILKIAGWLKTNPSEVEKEIIKKEIRSDILVSDIGDNLIKITYRDSKAMRAFITTKNLAELFIRGGKEGKEEESKAAYDFIDKQVNEYLEKLTRVEEELSEFRSSNPDSQSGSELDVSTRIRSIKNNLEKTRLSLKEEMIRQQSLKEQLSGEAAITISYSREGEYRGKISSFQERLESLRLDYKDTYPDIIRVKHQIVYLKKSLDLEIQNRSKARALALANNVEVQLDEVSRQNPIYQKLRSDLTTTKTKIATLKARKSEFTSMLEDEYERARTIHSGKAELSKLTRDYTVNKEIYQDLLRRRERARVSKSLDQEEQGLTFKIQESAKIPLIPTGIRFVHFAAAGLVLGLTVPIGLIFFMLQIDPRVRFSSVITTDLNIQVLADISRISSFNDIRKEKFNFLLLVCGVAMVLVIYGYVGWLKSSGQLG